jgi:hypothetical protein
MTGDTSAREHALSLVKETGWAVFRLAIGHDDSACDGGVASCKTIDFLRQSWPATSTSDPGVVGAWDWSAANGYGIDCGKSGIFVVDVDPGGKWSGPETRVHLTGRGEHHVYEDLIGLPSGKGLWPGVDTRGVGGMVIGPGSWHPHGAYAVAHEVPLAPVPMEAVTAARRPTPRPALAYDGPGYDDLTPEQRARADTHVEDTLHDWRVRLAVASGWPEGETDGHGRGWELLSRNFAWAVAILEATPWAPEVHGQVEFERVMPDDMLANEKCRKWRDDLPGKASRDVGPPPWLDPVFDATPTLRHVRQAAHSRLLSARGLLVCTLARLAVEVPIGTALPPVIGSRAALNLGVALVGGSGGGKSALFEVSRELLGLVGEDQKEVEKVPGSGEGLIETYLGKPVDDGSGGKARPLVADPRRLLYVDEIGQLGAVKDGRSGSTVGPTLRTMISGGMLGTENATADRRRHVPAGVYRAALVAGVQPAASDVLLNDHDVRVGTPQRFTWALTADPTIPDEDLPWPGALGWEPPPWPGTVEYPEHVKAEVRRQAREAARGTAREDDRIDGHARLTRLKVAALLAVLHGETAISDLWWRLAGVVAGEWTDEAIAECRGSLAESRARQATAAGRLRGHSRVAEEAVVDEDKARREAVTRQVLAAVADAGEGGATWSSVRNKVRSTSRAVADRLVGTPDDPGPLAESGQVRLEAVTYRGQDGVRVYRGAP